MRRRTRRVKPKLSDTMLKQYIVSVSVGPEEIEMKLDNGVTVTIKAARGATLAATFRAPATDEPLVWA